MEASKKCGSKFEQSSCGFDRYITIQNTMTWRQRRIELAEVLDYEFDVRVSVDNNVIERVSNLVETLEFMVSQEWLSYVLVGGVERASDFDDIPTGSRDHAKKEHVHLIMIYEERMPKWKVREHLGFGADDTGIYVNPRINAVQKNDKITYWGWRLHHIKDQTKLSDQELEQIGIDPARSRVLYEHGDLPNDDYVKCHKELLRVSNKYGNEQQKEEIRRFSTVPRKPRIQLGKKTKQRKDIRLVGRRKTTKTPEQLRLAKDRMANWLQKRDTFPERSEEWIHADNVVGKIRSDYFED